MLNITNNHLHKKIPLSSFRSGKHIFNKAYYKQFNKFLLAFAIIGLIILFLPWTQNITGQGQVTTLKPNQRPQTIQSQIPGRIEEWFVKEGDLVKQGDTILRISEVKSEYFDDKLIERTNDQINAKTSSVVAYTEKVAALNRQIAALQNDQRLKLQQAQNKILQANLKIKSDSIDLKASRINYDIAKRQFDRIELLYKEGLKAQKDVEEKRLKLQESQAKLISQENKFLSSKNQRINAQVELSRIRASYLDKISKTESDMYTAQSNQFDTEVQVTKLQNSNTNYVKRKSLLHITAPQSGYINKTLKAGIGETFKEGERLINIMPLQYDLAVETYVKPIDLPLLHLGEKVRVQFDGWPAIVFSGWPNASYGTYGAKVVAIENFISDNGKYRILLAPDQDDQKWPEAIRVGSGAKTIALLNDVPIWFELWRQLNSFPPNFYESKNNNQKTKKSL
ncbi:HlyD family secretion protein [Aquimarina sp. 2201CG5-10]|uniref:HlyD family secretion protein n=1 Tax=Aquimarina callyspongiae TaxID=3098150 RepID=UPI002AB3C958|nr:biotin/lipoyl-binding protein [Aquimarina sp. 2201CG5-10]MDY8135896.1 biotin/lipoyl-binding protein [Aquimarina sp. 2201CG5-10]